MKVRDQIAALAQFDPDEDVLPCAPAGMPFLSDDDLAGHTFIGDEPRHFSGAWPFSPRDGDTVRETGKRFGHARAWKRINSQWVLQTEAGEK